MGNIIYKSLKSDVRGKGKSKRAIVTAKFSDVAAPDRPRIYNLAAIDNAIRDRDSQRESFLATIFYNVAPDERDLSTITDSVRVQCEDKLKALNNDGLEFGRAKVLEEYQRLGLTPPLSKRARRAKRDAFTRV